MVKLIDFYSNFWILILNGKIDDLLIPDRIIIDFELEVITIKKRNWYLIGFHETINPFRFVKKIDIQQHLFGSDIQIKSLGNHSKIICIKKNQAEQIKNALIEYNSTRRGGFIIE